MNYSMFARRYGECYEITARGSFPSSSCAIPVKFSDSGSAFGCISSFGLFYSDWRGFLISAGIEIPTHATSPHQTLQYVAQLFARGQLVLYQLPVIERLPAIPAGNGVGYCFVRGPKPSAQTHLRPEPIKDLAAAQTLLSSIEATEGKLVDYTAHFDLLRSLFQYGGNITPHFAELLAKGDILAYKIPVNTNAPPKPQGALVPATGPMYQPTHDLPPPVKTTTPASTPKAEPQSLSECQNRLADARVKLDSEGYKPKYSDAQQKQKVKDGSVSKERFLVSFQTKNTNLDAKLAFQRESGLTPLWATSFDQLENADTDPKLIADVLGTPYDSNKEYVLHVIDRGEDGGSFGQDTIVPTWEKMQEVSPKLLKKHDPDVVKSVMTPEYQQQYAKNMDAYHKAGGNEFNDEHREYYAESLPAEQQEKFNARHKVRTEIGANSEFTGNGLTQSREGSTKYGVVETLTLENNPPPINQMKNVKTISLKPRGNV